METGLSSRSLGLPRASQRLPVRQARIHYRGWDGRGAIWSQRIPTSAIEIAIKDGIVTKHFQGIFYLLEVSVFWRFDRQLQMKVDMSSWDHSHSASSQDTGWFYRR